MNLRLCLSASWSSSIGSGRIAPPPKCAPGAGAGVSLKNNVKKFETFILPVEIPKAASSLVVAPKLLRQDNPPPRNAAPPLVVLPWARGLVKALPVQTPDPNVALARHG